MSGLNVFGNVWGCVGDPRAMTPAEIENWQVQNVARAQQAVFPDHYNLLLANHRPFPERPLDERFADFKVRLAEAIARRAK